MKILQIVPYFFPASSIGGSASAVYNLSKLLVKKGHKITVFTTDLFSKDKRIRNGEYIRESDGINVCYFHNFSNTLAFNQHIFLPLNIFKAIAKDIGNYDLIHLHEIYTLFHLWAANISFHKKIPFIISAHGTAMMAKEEGRVWQKKLFFNLCGYKMLDKSRILIALNDQERECYIRLKVKEDKIRVIPNGVLLKDITNLPPAELFRKKYSIGNKAKILLFLGRVHPKKGIELLLYALVKLKDQYDNIFLVIAGPIEDTGYYNKLQEIVKKYNLTDKVIFTGNLEKKEKIEAYASADLFILPSYAEGMPMSVLEACAFGLPVIISSKCGLPQIEKYKAGIIVEPQIDDIFCAVDTMIIQPKLLKSYGHNARMMINKEFNLINIAEKVEKIYKEVCTGRYY